MSKTITNDTVRELLDSGTLLVDDFTVRELSESLSFVLEQKERVLSALENLYNDTAEYITINHLGDVHHNKVMQDARDALLFVRHPERRMT